MVRSTPLLLPHLQDVSYLSSYVVHGIVSRFSHFSVLRSTEFNYLRQPCRSFSRCSITFALIDRAYTPVKIERNTHAVCKIAEGHTFQSVVSYCRSIYISILSCHIIVHKKLFSFKNDILIHFFTTVIQSNI